MFQNVKMETSLHPLIILGWCSFFVVDLIVSFYSVSIFFISSFSLSFYREDFVDLKRKAWQWYYKKLPRTMHWLEMKIGYSDKCHRWFEEKKETSAMATVTMAAKMMWQAMLVMEAVVSGRRQFTMMSVKLAHFDNILRWLRIERKKNCFNIVYKEASKWISIALLLAFHCSEKSLFGSAR